MFRPASDGHFFRLGDPQTPEVALSMPSPSSTDRFFVERAVPGDSAALTFGPAALAIAWTSIGSSNIVATGLFLGPEEHRRASKLQVGVVANYNELDADGGPGFEYSSTNLNNASLFPILMFVNSSNTPSTGTNLTASAVRWFALPRTHSGHGFSCHTTVVAENYELGTTQFYGSGWSVGVGIGCHARSTSNYTMTVPRISGSMSLVRYTKPVEDFEPAR